MKPPRHDSGFSLIELLVVISIVALLVALLMPTLGAARRAGRFAVCASQQHQIAAAALNYGADNRNLMPPSSYHTLSGWWTIPFWMNYHTAACYTGSGVASNGGVTGSFMAAYNPSADSYYCPLAAARPPSVINDDGGNPATLDRVYREGAKCMVTWSYFLYWSYDGYATQAPTDLFDNPTSLAPFVGPRRLYGEDQGSLLVSDALYWQDPSGYFAWESTHDFKGARASGYYWALPSGNPTQVYPDVRFNAAYLDGHVGSFRSKDTVYAHPGVGGNHPAQHYFPRKF